jgi:D-glycero-alpha-D-manno-heptose-7-phosphate kinase
VLITKTPLRISIGGGGTDLPSYYRRYGGSVISAAINKHVFIGMNRIFTDDYVVKYSTLERVESWQEIEHPIVRAVFEMHQIPRGIEMVSLADIPAGTGLGSSGAFTVGLLRAIYSLKREYISPEALAEEACRVEIDLLHRSVGKQDQYVASIGGLICMEFSTTGNVTVSPLQVDTQMLRHLEEHLLMFFTGYSRQSHVLLKDQQERTLKGDEEMVANLHCTRQLGAKIKEALEAGQPERYGELMHEHWLHKRGRSQGMSNACIDHWYETALRSGALGGKLIGAGGGGFLLFYAKEKNRLRKAMAQEGLEEVCFKVDLDGSSVLARSDI